MAYDLSGPAYDRTGPAPGVRLPYLLCSMPRSGSSLLSEALSATGRLGVPIEYFDRTDTFAELYARWRCRSLEEYISTIRRRRVTDDGVLGVKAHWFQLEQLADELGRTPAELIVEQFTGAHLVRVRRRDVLRQAVSWAMAQQTGVWGVRTDDDERAAQSPVGYDAALIDTCCRRIVEADRRWQELFADLESTALEVVYEDLVDSYADTVITVAAHIGVALDPDDVAPPRLRRQADDRSELWLARYREER
jgi:trehalose 2-sulfotransferase